MNKLSTEIKNLLFLIIVLSMVGFSVWRIISKKNDRSELVNSEYHFTECTIVSYTKSGSLKKYYLKYKYAVGANEWIKETSIPYKFFEGCEYDFSICSDKKFWVAYQKDDPSNSLINLDIEIQYLENPLPPESLDGFN